MCNTYAQCNKYSASMLYLLHMCDIPDQMMDAINPDFPAAHNDSGLYKTLSPPPLKIG